MLPNSSGALRVPPSLASHASHNHSAPRPEAPRTRRWWLPSRDPGLDDRLLRDMGLSRADVAAFLL